jgi:hypothetical protein
MAFRWFRKHQKVIWAGIVIISMITFVLLPSGAGQSVFDRLASSFRQNRSEPVLKDKLYGQTVSTNDLAQLRQQRLIARQALVGDPQAFYFYRQPGGALGQALMQVEQERGRLSKEMKDRLGQQNAANPLAGNEQLQAVQEQEAKLMQALQQLALPFLQLQMSKGADEAKQLLDFLVWRHQADQLGITLTRDAIDSQLRELTQQRVGLQDISNELTGMQGVTPELLEKALGDEFRVMMAQKALLGYAPGSEFGSPASAVTGVPAPVTPYQFWQYYQDQRTSLNAALVPVPVRPGDEKPTEQDQKLLQAMYDRYKTIEPRPDSPTPGFKEPRRVKVEWASADPSSPYYQKASAEAVEATRVASLQGLATGGLLSGLPFAADPYYLSQYSEMKNARQFDMAALTEPGFPMSVYASRPHAADAAAFLGTALGAAGTGGVPLGAAAVYQTDVVGDNAGDKDIQAAIARAARERVPFGVTLVLSGTQPGAPLGALGLVAYGQETPQTLPPEAVRPLVAARTRGMLAHDLVVGNMKAFQKALEDVRSKASGGPEAHVAAARAWVPKGLAEYHLDQHEAMKDLRDQYTIADDPALKPLKEALVRPPMKATPKTDEEMGTDLFKTQGEYQPTVWPPGSSLTDLSPFDRDRPLYLVWQTDEQKAFVPTFEQARDKVVAAWRLNKARAAARATADKLRAKAAETKGDIAKLTQLAAEQKAAMPIELRQVAREVPAPMAAPTAGHTYMPFQFPDTMPYPSKDWLDQMLDKLKEPGNAVVLANQPQTTFYVTVLEDRTPPSERTFADVYRDAANTFNRDQLLDTLTQQQQQKYREDFLKQLRAEATKDADGQYTFTPDYRKTLESRTSEAE